MSRPLPVLAFSFLATLALVATAFADSPADHAMAASMGKMSQAMSTVPMTGDIDQDFAAMMIPHHQGAIDMAQIELQYGTDPALRRMAKTIVAAQRKEIAQMQAWQRAHPAK